MEAIPRPCKLVRSTLQLALISGEKSSRSANRLERVSKFQPIRMGNFTSGHWRSEGLVATVQHGDAVELGPCHSTFTQSRVLPVQANGKIYKYDEAALGKADISRVEP
jgi:hypothetical protein